MANKKCVMNEDENILCYAVLYHNMVPSLISYFHFRTFKQTAATIQNATNFVAPT